MWHLYRVSERKIGFLIRKDSVEPYKWADWPDCRQRGEKVHGRFWELRILPEFEGNVKSMKRHGRGKVMASGNRG